MNNLLNRHVGSGNWLVGVLAELRREKTGRASLLEPDAVRGAPNAYVCLAVTVVNRRVQECRRLPKLRGRLSSRGRAWQDVPNA